MGSSCLRLLLQPIGLRYERQSQRLLEHEKPRSQRNLAANRRRHKKSDFSQRTTNCGIIKKVYTINCSSLYTHRYIHDVCRFKSKRNFFELMRFDFVIDEDLKIFLLEANMSPNLSSAHFPPNKLLYQQVLYNTLGLVGVGENIYRSSLAVRYLINKRLPDIYLPYIVMSKRYK